MVDATDHITGKTGLTPVVTLSKNGGAFAAAAGAVSEISGGWYSLAGNATDRETLGELLIHAVVATADPFDIQYAIVDYDPFADIGAILTDTGTTLDGKVDSILADTGTDGVIVASLANDSVTAAALKADAVTEIQNGLATPTNITAGTIATVTNLTNLPAMPADWVTASGVKADAVTKIQSGLALEATLTAIKGAGWTTETLAAIDVLIDAIKAKTDNLPSDPADDSDIDTQLAAIKAETALILADTGTDGVVLADDAITSAKYDETTAFPVKAADAGSTYIARTGADSDTLETLSDQLDVVASGAGAIEWTYNLVDGDSNPLEGASIWVTTDSAGSNVIASGTTNSSGNVTFYLDAGTYYIWGQKDGYNFNNPDTEVVA